MRRPDVILWDWDGTLLNSRVASGGALRRLGQETGVAVTEDDVTEVVGGHLVDFWYRHYGQNPIPQVKKFIAYYRELSQNVGLFPKVKEILSEIQKSGIPQIVVSNKNQDIILVEAEKLGVMPYFQKIVGTVNQGIGKPEKEFADLIFGAEIPKHIVMIGDGVSDMDFAKNIGAVGVFIRPDDKAVDLPYQYRFHNLDEVGNWIKTQQWEKEML